MTLVVTAIGRETIWVLADRRLSYANQPPRDDARKILSLDTTDGQALLTYAGLGATGLGTEPADWMAAVLRGRPLPLEASLSTIAEAMKKQVPPHLALMSRCHEAAHHVIVPAFVHGEPRLYTIELQLTADGQNYHFRYMRWTGDRAARPPSIALAGSGGIYLSQAVGKPWKRSLLKLVKAHDLGKISALAVADHLATLNWAVRSGLGKRGTVGPRCAVAWRHRRGSAHKEGGGHQFYTGITRDNEFPSLPCIVSGMDVNSIANVMTPFTVKALAAVRTGGPATWVEEMTAALQARPRDEPDENLR